MKIIKNLLLFASGIGIGYFAGVLLTQRKEQQRSNFEVEEVRKMYREKLEQNSKTNIDENEPENEVDQKNTEQYQENFEEYSKAYTIPAEQFGEEVGYSTCYLTCYSDNVVTDDMDEPLTNDEIVEILGNDFFEKMLISDILYIRNNIRHCDYEVTRDYKNYSQNVYPKVFPDMNSISSSEVEKKPHDVD